MASSAPRAINEYLQSSSEPKWPQALQIKLLAGATITLFLGPASAYFVVIGAQHGELDTVVGFSGMLVILFALTSLTLSQAGFRHLGLERRITPHHDDLHGDGIRVAHKFDVRVILLLLGTAIFLIPSILSRWISHEFTLMDETYLRIGGSGIAALLAIPALGLLVLSLIIRMPTELGLYPTGLRLDMQRRILFHTRPTSTFVEWDEITEITGGTTTDRNEHATSGHPVIRVFGARRLRGDEEAKAEPHLCEIPAYRLLSEPNILFLLLRSFLDNPDQRTAVSHADAVELLRPPPLLQRFRTAREQKAIQ